MFLKRYETRPMPVWGILPLLLILASSVSASSTIFMSIDGIDGEVLVAGYEKAIEIVAVDHEVAASINSTTDPWLTGRFNFSAFTLLKRMDKATPLLYQSMLQGTPHEIELHWMQSVPERTEFFTHRLRNARIVSIKTLTPTMLDPAYANYGFLEEIKIVADQIRWTWNDVEGGGRIEFEYDLATTTVSDEGNTTGIVTTTATQPKTQPAPIKAETVVLQAASEGGESQTSAPPAPLPAPVALRPAVTDRKAAVTSHLKAK